MKDNLSLHMLSRRRLRQNDVKYKRGSNKTKKNKKIKKLKQSGRCDAMQLRSYKLCED
jgi:hypothetical protein